MIRGRPIFESSGQAKKDPWARVLIEMALLPCILLASVLVFITELLAGNIVGAIIFTPTIGLVFGAILAVIISGTMLGMFSLGYVTYIGTRSSLDRLRTLMDGEI